MRLIVHVLQDTTVNHKGESAPSKRRANSTERSRSPSDRSPCGRAKPLHRSSWSPSRRSSTRSSRSSVHSGGGSCSPHPRGSASPEDPSHPPSKDMMESPPSDTPSKPPSQCSSPADHTDDPGTRDVSPKS